MATNNNTNFKDNDWASKYHRILGKICYYLDIDQTELEDSTMNKTLKEYSYSNGHPKTIALVDFKYPGKSLSDKYSAIQYQIYHSEHELKDPVPFFLVLTYLGEEFKVPAYYVIPANKYSRNYFMTANLPMDPGMWMTLKAFSKFQHALRKANWNGEEKVDATNLSAVSLPAWLQLKDLPNRRVKYPLPTFEFSWFKPEPEEAVKLTA